MDDANLVFWFCSLTNAAFAITFAAWFRRQVKARRFTETKAKTIYSWLCIVASIFLGIVLFIGITSLFNISLGHGEILIAAPIFNLLLSCVLIIAGRIIIGWVAVKW